MQHHYVLVYDDVAEHWTVDVDTAMALFEDTGYWHNGEEWVSDVPADTQAIYLIKEEEIANLIDLALGGE